MADVPQLAFVFPGQGVAAAGMAQDMVRNFPEAREVFEEASTVLRMDMAELCFRDPQDHLGQTRWAQPALLVACVACLSPLTSAGFQPWVVGGHSLGEYAALVAARALSLAEALRLVKARGELMQAAADRRPSAMTAILGLSDEQVVEVCAEVAGAGLGVVTAANFNAPGQVVISGEIPALERAEALARERGARRAVRLAVNGGFHSELMLEAAQGLEPLINQATFTWPGVPVVSNVNGQPVQDPEHLRDLLTRQLLSPVQWSRSVDTMQRVGAGAFVEFGPGRTLSNLISRIAPEVPALNVSDAASLDATVRALTAGSGGGSATAPGGDPAAATPTARGTPAL